MKLESTIEVGEYVLQVELPQRTKDVLTFESFISPRVILALGDDRRSGLSDALRWCIEWLAEWCTEVDEEWIDENLSGLQTHEACKLLIQKLATPESVANELFENGKTWGGGGCECPRCDRPDKYGGWEKETKTRVDKVCKFSKLSPVADHLIAVVSTHGGDPKMDLPYWLYDAMMSWEYGKAVGNKERRDKETGSQMMRSALKNGGR